MTDSEWGAPARTEWATIKEKTGTLVKINQEIAREDIKNGANVLQLIPIYERKVKKWGNCQKSSLSGGWQTTYQTWGNILTNSKQRRISDSDAFDSNNGLELFLVR